MQDESILLDFLLQEGVALGNISSWRFLALLMELSHKMSGCKQIITKLVRDRYGIAIGLLFDHLKDFQQANYVVELLSNLFPRISHNRLGVVLPPILWKSEDEKMNKIFGNPLYPFRGRHGDHQVTKFIWDTFNSNFGLDVLRLNDITYSSTNSLNGAKRFKRNTPESPCYCYIQVTSCRIYLWGNDGHFLEIERRCSEVQRNLKGLVKIKITGQPLNCIQSIDKSWRSSFAKVKWFQLELNDPKACESFFYNITSIRKISEVQTFLALTHEDEAVRAEEVIDQQRDSSKTPPESLPSELPGSIQSQETITGKHQLATPEQSDVKINTDEWDLNPSSDRQEELAEKVCDKEETDYAVTPEGSAAIFETSKNGDIEQSPLVLAQKRKMIRETTKTLDILKKEFALHNSVGMDPESDAQIIERSPSLVITKFETTNKGSGFHESGKLTEIFSKKVKGSHIKTPQGKSVGLKDIDLLDTIFRSKVPTATRKKPKRQQRLKNFKPVVDVASQNISHPKTRNQKKNSLSIAKRMRPTGLEEQSHGDSKSAHNEDGLQDHENSDMQERNKRKLALDGQKDKGEALIKKRLKQDSENARSLAAETKCHLQLPELPLNKCPNENPEKGIDKENNSESLADSTTILGNPFNASQMYIDTNNAFTDRLQEQIFSSITGFSNELIRKMTIINKELNNKIVKELSEKYQRLFLELQLSFQSDTEEMLKFMGEIKEMMNLPEDQLIHVIRDRKFSKS